MATSPPTRLIGVPVRRQAAALDQRLVQRREQWCQALQAVGHRALGQIQPVIAQILLQQSIGRPLQQILIPSPTPRFPECRH